MIDHYRIYYIVVIESLHPKAPQELQIVGANYETSRNIYNTITKLNLIELLS